jgi:hypothetical protein
MAIEKIEVLGPCFIATSLTALPILPIWPIFVGNWLDWYVVLFRW